MKGDRIDSLAAALRAGFLLGLMLGGDACGAAAEEMKSAVTQEIAFGGMLRVLNRDPGLIGRANGGTATSVNFDDGDLNCDRGLTALGLQGRTTLAGESRSVEFKVEAVYFYDFINADGRTEFHPLSEEARERAGRDLYLNEAYAGYRRTFSDASLGLRVGNQILRWSESASFGYSIAPVNPVSASRRYQPANTGKDAYVALPMLSAKLQSATGWSAQGFYLLGFSPSENEAAGTFLSGNDYYSPGGRYLQLGQGSPAVPDSDASVVTPVTPFGSRVSRAPDREPASRGQYGIRIETPELEAAKLRLAGYAMRVHSREPVVSIHTGTLQGLLGVTASDYVSSGNYFVEYVPGVTVLGTSARFVPARYTGVSLDYSARLGQPLQIDDELLITAGLAPAAATAACTPPGAPACAPTLAALNRNPLIAARGGITAANASGFFGAEISGYERFDVSQYSASVLQGLPPALGAKQWTFAAEIGGLYIHNFRDRFLDASVTVRPDASGARRNGFATRSAWGYRLVTRLDYAELLGMRMVSPSLTWIHDMRGNAPITLGTLLEDNRSVIAAVDFAVDKGWDARVAYRTFLGKGSDADRFTDRDFVSFSVTRKF